MHASLHYLDLIAPVFTIVGVWLLGHKRKSGFMVAAGGSILWLTSGLLGTFAGRPMWGLVINSVVMMYLNTTAWLRWRRDEPKMFPWPKAPSAYVPPEISPQPGTASRPT